MAFYYKSISRTYSSGHHSRLEIDPPQSSPVDREDIVYLQCVDRMYSVLMSDTKLVRHVRVQIRANWTYFRSPYIFYVFRNSLRSILHSRKICRMQEPSQNDIEYIRHFELIENELNLLSDSETRIRTDNKEIKVWINY